MTAPTLLQYLGLNTMQVRCPLCHQVFQTQLKTLGKQCVECGACGVPLVREVTVQEKPNNLLLTVNYYPVQIPEAKNQKPNAPEKALRVVG